MRAGRRQHGVGHVGQLARVNASKLRRRLALCATIQIQAGFAWRGDGSCLCITKDYAVYYTIPACVLIGIAVHRLVITPRSTG